MTTTQRERPAAPAGLQPDVPSIPWTGLALIVAIAGLLLLMAIPDRARTPEELMIERAEIELRQRLESLRSAIADYHADHGVYPGLAPATDGTLSPQEYDARWMERQLRMHSDDAGDVVPEHIRTHPHGPYLGQGVPRNPVNHLTTVKVLGRGESMPADADGTTGWVFDPSSGEIRANSKGRLLRGGRYFEL